MSLKLSSTNTPPYDYFSEGDGSNPIRTSVILDSSGGTEDSNVVDVYLIATQYRYTDINISFINEEAGIDWKISNDNGVTWSDTLSITEINALSGDQVVPLKVKAVVNDDGSLLTGIYTQADVQIQALERPE